MNWNIFQWRSLKTRVTFTMLGIFVIGIWSLAFYASRMLRDDMERLLADQQSSTVAYVAAELNDELHERVLALENVARSIDQAMLIHPAALQKLLETRPISFGMFNSGVVAVSLDGIAVADVPVVTGRRGTSYASNVATHTALTEGKSVIGRPLVGRVLKEPLFNINTPIRDDEGKVIGALFGVINLTKPNFLDRVAENRYGKSGGYLVIDLENNLIVTASEKSRVLQPLPASGINAMIDKRRQGFLDSAVSVNSLGEEVLSSASRIPASNWLVVAALPTEEAFAPIRGMQRRILLVAIFLTVLAGLLTWWMLRRQLAPMLAAASALATLSDTNQPPQPLPIARQDEIGELIGGFNRLLESLGQREEALKESQYRQRFALEGTGDGVWDVNFETQQAHYSKRFLEMLGYAEGDFKGKRGELNDHIHPEDRFLKDEALQAYLDGRAKDYSAQYRLRCKDGSYKWVHVRGMAATRGEDGKALRMIGTTSDITERKQAEDMLTEFNLTLEQRVIDRTNELLVANQSLKQEIRERRVAEASAADFAARLQVMTRRHAGAQEAERRRLARELHDRVSSSLTAIGLGLGLIAKQQPQDVAASVSARLSDTMTLLKDAIANAREISHDLHPSVLEYGGVLPALEEYGRKFSGTTGIAVEVVGKDRNIRLPPEMEIALYRIAQEALTNCAKHAEATMVTIELNGDAENLVFVISDDGAGIDPRWLTEGENRPGLGLLSMRERAEAIGTTLSLESAFGSGTRITVRT